MGARDHSNDSNGDDEPFAPSLSLDHYLTESQLRALEPHPGEVDRPTSRVEQNELTCQYLELSTEYHLMEAFECRRELGTLENKATYLVLRLLRSEQDIFNMTEAERSAVFLEELERERFRWTFYQARNDCLNTLAQAGILQSPAKYRNDAA